MSSIARDKGVRASALVVPDVSGLSQRAAAHAYLDSGLMPHPWKVSGGTKVSCYSRFEFHRIRETHDLIDLWRRDWRCGLVVSKSSGLIALDVDDVEVFEDWDFMELPLTARQLTGREGGGLHLLFDARSLADRDWPMQGNIPGGQIKSNGFIAVEPSLHPSGRAYAWVGSRSVARIGRLGAALSEYRNSSNGNGNGSGKGIDVAALLGSGIAPGEQDNVLTALMMKLRGEGLSRDVASMVGWSVLRNSRTGVDASGRPSRKGSWTVEDVARKWDSADRRLRREEAALRGVDSPALTSVEEEDFWSSRIELSHVRSWARARRAGPWAVLGQCLAQAVCHVGPDFVLPALVGGYGTLNMLIAVTGGSGDGKSAAAASAASAFDWSGDGLMIPDSVPVFPLGSGEGLVKNFGYMGKSADGSGRFELVRSCLSCIVTIDEIDTFSALSGRSGATISPQLRQLYSGEALGFGYADAAKRVVIPAGSYRAVVIAGVQPGRGSAILDDVESGFAQRWLWLPAVDTGAPDLAGDDPSCLAWSPPVVDSDVVVMDVCSRAVEEIDSSRLARLRSGGGGLEAHAAYTRLKVAAALALLSGSDCVDEGDWELSGLVMKVSDGVRAGVSSRLAAVAHEDNVKRGRSEAVRMGVVQDSLAEMSLGRISSAVLRKIPSDSWISGAPLRSSIAARDRSELAGVLERLVSDGIVESRSVRGNGDTRGIQYRRTGGVQ